MEDITGFTQNIFENDLRSIYTKKNFKVKLWLSYISVKLHCLICLKLAIKKHRNENNVPVLSLSFDFNQRLPDFCDC